MCGILGPGWWCPMIMDWRVKRNIIESITRSLMRPQITQAADTRCCPLWLADIGVWCPEQNTSPGPCQDCQQCGVYKCGLVTRSPVTAITAHCWAHSDHWASDLGEKIPGGARAGPAPDITSNNAPPARAPHCPTRLQSALFSQNIHQMGNVNGFQPLGNIFHIPNIPHDGLVSPLSGSVLMYINSSGSENGKIFYQTWWVSG